MFKTVFTIMASVILSMIVSGVKFNDVPNNVKDFFSSEKDGE